jgi:hypothetical protein
LLPFHQSFDRKALSGRGEIPAPVLSPMLAHAKDIKERHPNAKVIFLGPCISKKNEIEMYPGGR